eukprot:m.35743 g.35743  ORF g.35743 m.35743 type:complete len:411 (-) comp9919_c0_seq2:390-1622(-)
MSSTGVVAVVTDEDHEASRPQSPPHDVATVGDAGLDEEGDEQHDEFASDELEILDMKLKKWLLDEHDAPIPETQAEDELYELCRRAHDGDLIARYLVACTCLHREMFTEAGKQLRLITTPQVQEADPLLHLNAMFQLGALLFDGFVREGSTEDSQQSGLHMMQQVAEIEPSHFRKPPPELVDATELVTSAQFNVGRAFNDGVGVEINYAEAERLWLLAARDGAPTGSHQAMNQLGHFYSRPRRLDQRDPLALTKPDLPEAISWHKCATALGNADSAYELGTMHRDGVGMAKDQKKALELIKSAAEAGHDLAETALAVHYYTLRLYNKAVQWATRVVQPLVDVSDQQIADSTERLRVGQARACWYLARCCRLGLGVEGKNAKEAQVYLDLAKRLSKDEVVALEKKAAVGEV